MDTQRIMRMTDRGAIERAKRVIADGAALVLPTDTVYGIGVDPFDRRAINKLQEAKGRTNEFPPPVLVADLDDVHALALRIPETAQRLAAEHWPGGLTLVLKAADAVVSLSEETGTVGVRIPAHEPARELLRATGPLAVSSANRHGSSPAMTVEEAVIQLGSSVALYLDGGQTAGSVPSTVVDLSGARVRILRVGTISREQIELTVGNIHA